MSTTTIRDACAADFGAITALNLAFEHFLSPMDTAHLHALHAIASYHRVVEHKGQVIAFLMAHMQGTGYDSDNYAWFSQRYERFVYIDRVVIAQEAQGMGLGKLLYEDLFQWACVHASPCVTLEFDIDPPNIGSEGFHHAMGFTSVGTHTVATSGKQVNMQLKKFAVL
jgi:uncharacterized protein